MSHYEEEAPRLSPIAKIGFAGAFCALIVAGGVYYLHHKRLKQPTGAASDGISADTLADPTVAAFIAGAGKAAIPDKPADDVTGSLPDPKAGKDQLGPVSGLPMPRFVSLKPDRVNVRQGPSRDQTVSFIYQKSNLPVEVIAEFENWRRIRDWQGAEGWVYHSMLSGKRTAVVVPTLKDELVPIYDSADPKAGVVAKLQGGVLSTLKACSGSWCEIAGTGFEGWIKQDRLWGAYPNEKVD